MRGKGGGVQNVQIYNRPNAAGTNNWAIWKRMAGHLHNWWKQLLYTSYLENRIEKLVSVEYGPIIHQQRC